MEKNASLGKRMPFLLKLINSRGISLIFSHLCLPSAIQYVTRHLVNFRLGASRPEYKERDQKLNSCRPSTKNETENLNRGPKSYFSAHRDPKNKEEFDNANGKKKKTNKTTAAFRPE